MEKELLSTAKVAEILGVSRIAVFKKIKSGEIRAVRAGRAYLIPRAELPDILTRSLSDTQKKNIDRAVHRTVREYGEALKLLGRE